jgi:CelD/BcsL family acetyltransferase involved in cellulose biosynthesis
MDFETIRTREGFLALKDAWEQLAAEIGELDFYLTFDWFYAMICLAQNPPTELFIVTARSQGKLVAIIPCCIARRRLRVFSFRCLELIGNLYTPYRGAVVLPGRERGVAEGFADFILNDCSHDWDVVNFEDMSLRDPFVAGLKVALDGRNVRARLTEQYENILTDFSPLSNSGEYFRSLSRNRRNMIQKGINKMNREGTFDIVLTTNARQDVDTAMIHYYEIYAGSWKEPERDSEFHLKLARHLAEKEMLRLFILYFRPRGSDEGEEMPHPYASYEGSVAAGRPIPEGYTPVAAYFFVVCGRQAYYLKSAYLQDYPKYSLGSVLFWFAAKRVFEVDGVRFIDHQKGGEAYKLSWGKLNEVRYQYQAANPKSLPARFELWSETHCIPKLRMIRRKLKRPSDHHGENKE